MIGSAVIALVLLARLWMNPVLAEAVTGPMFFLLLVVVGVAIAAIATLLRRTRYSRLAGLASIGSLVGLAFLVVGLLTIQEFVGLVPMFIGVLVLTAAVGVLGVLSVVTNVLGWWGSMALVSGPLFLFFAFFGPLLPPMHWLLGVPWMVLGFAIFRAGAHQAEQPSRVH